MACVPRHVHACLCVSLVSQLRGPQPPERAESVVERHDDDVLVSLNKSVASRLEVVACSCDVASAIDPYHDRDQTAAELVGFRSEYIEGKTVFRHLAIEGVPSAAEQSSAQRQFFRTICILRRELIAPGLACSSPAAGPHLRGI